MGIAVNEESVDFCRRKGRGQVDGSRSFPDATLLVGYRDYASHLVFGESRDGRRIMPFNFECNAQLCAKRRILCKCGCSSTRLLFGWCPCSTWNSVQSNMCSTWNAVRAVARICGVVSIATKSIYRSMSQRDVPALWSITEWRLLHSGKPTSLAGTVVDYRKRGMCVALESVPRGTSWLGSPAINLRGTARL